MAGVSKSPLALELGGGAACGAGRFGAAGADDRSTEAGSDASPASDPLGSLIILDWDDTLLPTTWLRESGQLFATQLPEAPRAALAELAEVVEDILRKALAIGRVIIVTNALEGCVQDSAGRFLPAVAPMLAQLTIVSARSVFEPLGVHSPTEWKSLAFHGEVSEFCERVGDQRYGSVLAVGDSVHEHSALLRSTSGQSHCFAKSLKFAPRPCPQQLVEELLLAAGALEEIVEFEGDLDIDIGGSA